MRPYDGDDNGAASALGGVYPGIVANNHDDEGPGWRVKVRFPWLPGGDEDQLHWAPIAAPTAGPECGVFTLPEVDDTVYVVFLGGDVRAPVVIGGAWSREDPPPETNEHETNDVRFIKSRSGHRLLFEDSDETKVALDDGTQEHVLGCGSFTAGGDSPNRRELPTPKGISGTPKEGVAVSTEAGTLRLQGTSGTVSVEARDVEITARGELEVHAGGELKVAGSGPGKVVSAKKVKLQGGRLSAGS